MINYQELLKLLNEGKSIGVDLADVIEKVKRFTNSLEQDTIKIVLLGSVSDGKTTLVGGLIGKVLDNMKISQEESSDQLEFYGASFLNREFIFVDTPGLFGSKEKPIDGKTVKFSDITTKYISEADMMIYVCDAVNPFPESHTEVMKKILIDYNKLNTTIFVINKMDEAGTILLDEEDYQRMSSIKKDNLRNRICDRIGITSEQAENLNMICVAADPKGKGLSHWFSKMEDYLKRSKLGLLTDVIKTFTADLDKTTVKDNTEKSVIGDVVAKTYTQLSETIAHPKHSMSIYKTEISNLENNQELILSSLKAAKKNMSQSISAAQDRIISMINCCGLENANDVLQKLGIKNEKLTFYRMIDEISQILSETSEENNNTFQSSSKEINVSFVRMNETTKGLVQAGAKGLKGLNLQNTDVLKARDAFAKITDFKYKFKPHGAKKLATKIGKLAKWGGFALSGGLMAWDLYSSYRNGKKLKELKRSLLEAVNCFFSEEILPLYQTDQDFYQNFAPSYIELLDQINTKKKEIDNIEKVVVQLDDYKGKIKKWLDTEDIEYVDFEEI